MKKRRCKKCEYYNDRGGCWAIKGKADPTHPRCDYRVKEGVKW